MGYFDPPRITESTMRDSIRKSLAPAPSLWLVGAARPFRVPASGGLEARWRKEKKGREGRGRKNEKNRGRGAGRHGRKRRKERHEFWPVVRKPRRQMRTSKRGYVVERTFSSSCSLLPSSPPAPSWSTRPFVDRVHRRTSRCNLLRGQNVHLYAVRASPHAQTRVSSPSASPAPTGLGNHRNYVHTSGCDAAEIDIAPTSRACGSFTRCCSRRCREDQRQERDFLPARHRG